MHIFLKSKVKLYNIFLTIESKIKEEKWLNENQIILPKKLLRPPFLVLLQSLQAKWHTMRLPLKYRNRPLMKLRNQNREHSKRSKSKPNLQNMNWVRDKILTHLPALLRWLLSRNLPRRSTATYTKCPPSRSGSETKEPVRWRKNRYEMIRFIRSMRWRTLLPRCDAWNKNKRVAGGASKNWRRNWLHKLALKLPNQHKIKIKENE